MRDEKIDNEEPILFNTNLKVKAPYQFWDKKKLPKKLGHTDSVQRNCM